VPRLGIEKIVRDGESPCAPISTGTERRSITETTWRKPRSHSERELLSARVKGRKNQKAQQKVKKKKQRASKAEVRNKFGGEEEKVSLGEAFLSGRDLRK